MQKQPKMTQEFQLYKNLRSIVILLLLLSPTLMNLVEHASSGIVLLLTLTGIYAFFASGQTKVSRKSLFSSWEKAIMGVFVFYFAFVFLMNVAYNLYNDISILKIDVDNELRMLAFLPIYYLFVISKPQKETIWFSVIFGAITSGIYALIISLFSGFSSRVVGPYNPILFGCVSLALSFMSLYSYRYFDQEKKKLIFLPILGFACGLLATFLSGTRGAVIAIPFLVVIIIFYMRPYLRTYNLKILLGAIGGACIFLLFLFPNTHMAERFERGIEGAKVYISNPDCFECVEQYETIYLRLWMEAFVIIKNNPLTGVGPDGYRKAVTERVEKEQIAPGIEKFKTPHNMYLMMLSSYGAGGLLVLVVFFMVPLIGLVYTIKKYGGNSYSRDIAYCGLSLIVGYMVFSLTESLLNRNLPVAFYVIMLAAVLSVTRKSSHN